MFRSLRVKREVQKVVEDAPGLSAEQLASDPSLPITLRQINNLPGNAQRRVYRTLLPSTLLGNFGIDPITWKGTNGMQSIRLQTDPTFGRTKLSVIKADDFPDDIVFLDFGDNAYNGIDLHFLLINDPDSPRFCIDFDEQGRETLFGSARRNLAEEEQAMQAGLAPAQPRASLRASRQVLDQMEIFLATLGHRAYFLEPLTYASAWLFERRGFAYVRGHKLMDDIHREFQPGGRLQQALDGSTPFRQPEAWRTVRGRAWAIHDGILEHIDARWDGMRMVKQVGRHAGVETFPQSIF